MRPMISDNPLWEDFAQRALVRTGAGGAEFGEVLVAVDRVAQADEGVDESDAWFDSWTATADRLDAMARDSFAKGHRVSARNAWLRACTYHQIACFPLFGPGPDPRVVAGFGRQTNTFECAAELLPHPVIPAEIAFEGSRMQGYLCLPDDSAAPRPTIVHTNGYDGTVHEMYFAHALAALARGYNILLFDGPGQGRMLIRDGVPIQPDWERVVAAAIDWAVARPEVDADRVVLAGWSFGGFLAPRAACFEHRPAALVADPGQWDQRANLAALPLSAEQIAHFPEGVEPEALAPLEEFLRSPDAPAALRWRLLQRGPWVHGVPTLFDYFADMARFELSSYAGQISCPTFLTAAEGDATSAAVEKLATAIGHDRVTVAHFRESEGAGGHCESLGRSLYHQRMYDWLDETLG